jgi:hypothetical protein
MSNLTRDALIKTIVAEEMRMCMRGCDYTNQLKSTYRYWENLSSEDLCNKYNQIHNTNVTVDCLQPKY